MKSDQILILTAVQMEAGAVQREIRNTGVHVQVAGIRAGYLPDKNQLSGLKLIVLCGIAGALDPTLNIGDVILDDPEHRIPDSPIYRRGRIHTASQIIASPQEKAKLFAQTGALAVDMEQATVRDFAAGEKIPVIGVRAISDRADQILDPAVVNLVDDLGRPKALKIAMALICRPGLIPYLGKLSRNTNIALNELGKAVRLIVEELTA